MSKYRTLLLTAHGQILALLGCTGTAEFSVEKQAILETFDLLETTIVAARATIEG
jgi:hypothetical protein